MASMLQLFSMPNKKVTRSRFLDTLAARGCGAFPSPWLTVIVIYSNMLAALVLHVIISMTIVPLCCPSIVTCIAAMHQEFRSRRVPL